MMGFLFEILEVTSCFLARKSIFASDIQLEMFNLESNRSATLQSQKTVITDKQYIDS